MVLQKRIPNDFYKLFRTRNMESYMRFLVAIYEENNEVYAALGLTREEGTAVIGETMAKAQIVWEEEKEEESGEESASFSGVSPSGILNRLIAWGWLKSDFDEKMNRYVISFPEYSQLYVELFKKLQSEDDSRERESILSIYSALFTFHSDKEKNNDILQNALQTSKRLGQLLSNMQDGMRTYFDKLSARKNFIGIQEVLVEEINNSDSRKYAILTTTDSFYRYKEAVKELISQILSENEQKKEKLQIQQKQQEKNSVSWLRSGRAIEACEKTGQLVYQVEREFDLIERKYNKLVEQKAVFARRALARVRYILQEGTDEEDNLLKLIHLLDISEKKEEILAELRDKMKFTSQFSAIHDNSFYNRKEKSEQEFRPLTLKETKQEEVSEITDFIPKPLYTQKQLLDFKKKNMRNGKFTVTEETVQSVEDLEKLMFLWQESVEDKGKNGRIKLEGELQGISGFTFTGFTVEEE